MLLLDMRLKLIMCISTVFGGPQITVHILTVFTHAVRFVFEHKG